MVKLSNCKIYFIWFTEVMTDTRFLCQAVLAWQGANAVKNRVCFSLLQEQKMSGEPPHIASMQQLQQKKKLTMAELISLKRQQMMNQPPKVCGRSLGVGGRRTGSGFSLLCTGLCW